MEQGYYSVIATPREALYEAACAMDNQDVPLEDWPRKLIAALTRAGFVIVPAELPHDVLGRAAIAALDTPLGRVCGALLLSAGVAIFTMRKLCRSN